MTVNPFEPPRADPAGSGSSAPAPALAGSLPEAAVAHLVASGRWARLAFVANALGLVVAVGQVLAQALRAANKTEATGVIFSLAVTLPIGVFFAVLYRRYAHHAGRLGQREPGALTGLLEAQQTIFKAFGVLLILALGLVVLVTIGGIVLALISRR